jgi:hypothetical protein
MQGYLGESWGKCKGDYQRLKFGGLLIIANVIEVYVSCQVRINERVCFFSKRVFGKTTGNVYAYNCIRVR